MKTLVRTYTLTQVSSDFPRFESDITIRIQQEGNPSSPVSVKYSIGRYFSEEGLHFQAQVSSDVMALLGELINIGKKDN